MACVGALVAGLGLGGLADAATITVNTTVDENGSGTHCSLREAVDSVNGGANSGGCTHTGTYGSNDTILLPVLVAGSYNLTNITAGPNEDLNNSDDLDIKKSVTISATAPTPTIRGPSGYSGRLIQVFSPAVATIKKVSMGIASVPGTNAGGCLRVESGATLSLNSSSVANCSAGGNAGAILNIGTLHLTATTVQTSTANGQNGGGGIFNDNNATLTVENSLIRGNTAMNGAGLYCDSGSTVYITGTTIQANTADPTLHSGIGGSGGGIYCLSAHLTLRTSTINANFGQGSGGGIGTSVSTLLVEDSVVANNTLLTNNDTGSMLVEGGGMAICCNSTIRRSVIRDNTVQESRPLASSIVKGGGLIVANQALVEDTSIANNTVTAGVADISRAGGGLYIDPGISGFEVTLVNVTISGNTADKQGGGIYANHNSTLVLLNTTVYSNSGDDGGGLALEAGGAVTLTNSVLAANVDTGGSNHPDCNGAVQRVSFSHMQSTSGCTFASGSPTTGAAGLAALANNGGYVVGDSAGEVAKTHRPLAGSILIDAGDPAGCRDSTNAVLSTDERGIGRPSSADGVAPICDIGAVELHYPSFTLADVAVSRVISPPLPSGAFAYTFTLQNTDLYTVTTLTFTSTASLFMTWDTYSAGCTPSGLVLVCHIGGSFGPGATAKITATASLLPAVLPNACGDAIANNLSATAVGFDGSAGLSQRNTSASTNYVCLLPSGYLPLVLKQ